MKKTVCSVQALFRLSTNGCQAYAFTAITCTLFTTALLWSSGAAATPIRVQWNPSLTVHADSNKPFPARSMYSVIGGADTSALIAGSDLETVGLTNDSNGHFSFQFGNAPDSFSADAYLNFSLTPGSGYQADLGGLYLATDRYHAIPDNYILRTSLDGFVSDIVGSTWFGPDSQGYAGIKFDLSSLEMITAATTFHLHMFDSVANDGVIPIYDSIHTSGYGLWFGGIEVSDYSAPALQSNAVPEPGTLILLGIGLAGLCRLKRKPVNEIIRA